MKTTHANPWYKQFWPWFLISVPLISIILSFTMLKLATSTKDSLVIDDYYKEGKGINLELTKYQEAKVLGLAAELTVSDQSVQVRFTGNKPDAGQTLALTFQHTTLADRDFSILLSRDASGNYRGSYDQDATGKWRVSLAPLSQQWKLADVVTLPVNGSFTLVP